MIRGSNAEQMVGHAESDNPQSRIYAGSFLKTPRDVENLVVKWIDGIADLRTRRTSRW